MFSALVQGYQDEWSEDTTWDTWKPFHAPLDAATPLTPESFRTLIAAPPERTVEFRDFASYFDYIDDPSAGFDDDTRATFDLLRTIMTAVLSGPTTIVAGEGQLLNVKIFLVGRLTDGSVVGIRAIAVET